MTIIAIQGHVCNLRNCPCIAGSVLDDWSCLHKCSQPQRQVHVKPWQSQHWHFCRLVLHNYREFGHPLSSDAALPPNVNAYLIGSAFACSIFHRIWSTRTKLQNTIFYLSNLADQKSTINNINLHHNNHNTTWLYYSKDCAYFWLIGECINVFFVCIIAKKNNDKLLRDNCMWTLSLEAFYW